MGFGLDNINSIEELYMFVKDNIIYGFKSQNDDYYIRKDISELLYIETLYRNYYLQSPKELMQSKIGLCYDQLELIRYWLNNKGYKNKSYFSNIYNHSIITYELNNKYYWIETTLKKSSGIYEFDSIQELINYYLKFIIKDSKIKYEEALIYTFDSVNFGCDFYDYVTNITQEDRNLILRRKI